MTSTPADPAQAPRAHRDPREVEHKRQLLDAPHVAPLTEFVRRLRAAHGGTVPWFDPTEAVAQARILLLFENPGRRADAAQGSGFTSADNDDKSAENMWGFFREAGIDRRRDIVAWNIVPWYLGDDRKIGEVRASDIEEARPALLEFTRAASRSSRRRAVRAEGASRVAPGAATDRHTGAGGAAPERAMAQRPSGGPGGDRCAPARGTSARGLGQLTAPTNRGD